MSMESSFVKMLEFAPALKVDAIQKDLDQREGTHLEN